MTPWHEWTKSSKYVTVTAGLGLVIVLAQAIGALNVIAEWQPLATKSWTVTELERRRVLRVEEQTKLAGDLQESVNSLSEQVTGIQETFEDDRVERLRFELSQMRFQRVQMIAQVELTPANLQLRGILADMDAAIEDKQRTLSTAICAAAGRVC